MARLIDAKKLEKEIKGAFKETNPVVMGVLLRWIRREPTVDAVPVVHGRWNELPSMAPEYECSECGQSYEWWEVTEAHYCPNCGAKMDLEVKDGE